MYFICIVQVARFLLRLWADYVSHWVGNTCMYVVPWLVFVSPKHTSQPLLYQNKRQFLPFAYGAVILSAPRFN